jgi:RimJ/RimL family protein N-acetyltransferase
MIRLEPFERPDFDTLISWIPDEEMLVQFAGFIFNFPLTAQQLYLYLEDKNRFAYKVVESSTNKTLGHAEILLPGKKTAALCRIIIGNPENRHQGLGQIIIKNLLEISFNQLEAEKCELNVFDWNKAAIKCYENTGFVINEDKIQERNVNGETWTALNMEMDKMKWESMQPVPLI